MAALGNRRFLRQGGGREVGQDEQSQNKGTDDGNDDIHANRHLAWIELWVMRDMQGRRFVESHNGIMASARGRSAAGCLALGGR